MAKLTEQKSWRLGNSKHTKSAYRQIYTSSSSSSLSDTDDEHLKIKSFRFGNENNAICDSQEYPFLDIDLKERDTKKIEKIVDAAKKLRHGLELENQNTQSPRDFDFEALSPWLPPSPPTPKAPPPSPSTDTSNKSNTSHIQKGITRQLNNSSDIYFDNTQTPMSSLIQEINYNTSLTVDEDKEKMKNISKIKNRTPKNLHTSAKTTLNNYDKIETENVLSISSTFQRFKPLAPRDEKYSSEEKNTKPKITKHINGTENKTHQEGKNEKDAPVYCQMRSETRSKNLEAAEQSNKQKGLSSQNRCPEIVLTRTDSNKSSKTHVLKDKFAKAVSRKQERGFLPPIVVEKRPIVVCKPVAEIESRAHHALADRQVSDLEEKKCVGSGRRNREPGPRSRKKDSDQKLPPLKVSRKQHVAKNAVKTSRDIVPRLPLINGKKPCQDTSVLLRSLAYARKPALLSIKKIFFY